MVLWFRVDPHSWRCGRARTTLPNSDLVRVYLLSMTLSFGLVCWSLLSFLHTSVPPAVMTDEQKARLSTKRPMTKEEYEARQSVIRKVLDPETGRTRYSTSFINMSFCSERAVIKLFNSSY